MKNSQRDYMRGYMRHVRSNAKRSERIWETVLRVAPVLLANALKETGGTWESEVAEDAIKIAERLVASRERKLGSFSESPK